MFGHFILNGFSLHSNYIQIHNNRLLMGIQIVTKPFGYSEKAFSLKTNPEKSIL